MLKIVKLIFPLIFLVSCSGGNIMHSPCEERCEYNRRDCIETCGGYNSAGFSLSFGKGATLEPFSCSERCEKSAERCLARCKSEE